MDRRSFLRVALLGGAGAATVVACPEFIADILIPKKSYFFMGFFRRERVLLRRGWGLQDFSRAVFSLNPQSGQHERHYEDKLFVNPIDLLHLSNRFHPLNRFYSPDEPRPNQYAYFNIIVADPAVPEGVMERHS